MLFSDFHMQVIPVLKLPWAYRIGHAAGSVSSQPSTLNLLRTYNPAECRGMSGELKIIKGKMAAMRACAESLVIFL